MVQLLKDFQQDEEGASGEEPFRPYRWIRSGNLNQHACTHDWHAREAASPDRRRFPLQSIIQRRATFGGFHRYLVARGATETSFGTGVPDGFGLHGDLTGFDSSCGEVNEALARQLHRCVNPHGFRGGLLA